MFFLVESTLDFCPTVSVSAPESLWLVILVKGSMLTTAEADELFKTGFVFNHRPVKEAQFFKSHLLAWSLF